MNVLLNLLAIYILTAFGNIGANPKEFLCHYTKKPVTIDANLKEWSHSHANAIIIRDDSEKGDSQMKAWSLWDDKNLYFAYEVRDNDLQAKQTALDHRELWLDDMIEFLIDPLNEKDSCWDENDIIYHINLLGQKKDDRGTPDCLTNSAWNGNADYKVGLSGSLNDPTDRDTGYTIEISISWDEIGVTPLEGLRLGVDFACGDKDGGTQNSFYDWVGARPFRSPYAFGDLLLTKKLKLIL